jgi:hypothetical protein
MDIVTAVSAGKSLLELGQEISKVVKKAQDSPDVTKRVLLYLDASRAAVKTLGLERQHILTDVRRCDVSDPHQVNALWTRLDRYLHEDNIRPQLESSIRGLGACRNSIKTEAKGAWWRKRNKEAAVETFSSTLNELVSLLQDLTSDFYPGRSGMGIQTLVPIFELISRIRDDIRLSRFQDTELELIDEELSERASAALRDSSHEDWFRTTGKVEALVAELQLAFSIKVTEALTSQIGS